jgi:alpha/beta superfamily hydrolase
MIAAESPNPDALTAPRHEHLLVFAHGKESGPWGTKISQLARVAEACGYTVHSPDYRQTMDPDRRVEQLLELAPRSRGALVLAGSSMGGYVSAMASARLEPDALFLIAPALYFPGYDREPPPPPALTRIVHGWHDDVVPVASAIRFAQRHGRRLTLLDGGHTLNERIPELATELHTLLEQAKLHAAYRNARYLVHAPAGPVELTIGELAAASERLIAARCGIEMNWAIVTACNPFGEVATDEDNAQAMAELQQRVEAEGLRWLPTAALDPEGRWPAEVGLLLCDPQPGFAEALGREFRQNAIVRAVLGAPPELRWLR